MTLRRRYAPKEYVLTDQDRLTIMNYLLRSTLVANGSPFTLFDRLEALGLEPGRLLENAEPMAAPPMKLDRYWVLSRWPKP